MALNIEQSIVLSEYVDNPNPKLVDQLVIIHEALEGEIVQYYINRGNSTEGDKNSYALGIPVKDSSGRTTHYTYQYYDELIWNEPKGRITRQKIDLLGVKAFPGVGAIAYYKFAYRSLSQILAPVNHNPAKTRSPILEATISADQKSVTFTFTDPPGIDYMAYRVCMILDYHCLEYITYEKEITIFNVPVTATYACYAIGYLNEGEVYSYESSIIDVPLVGLYAQWPPYSPGNDPAQRQTLSIVLSRADWVGGQITVEVTTLKTTHHVELAPPKATSVAMQSAVVSFYNSQLAEVSHTDGFLTLFAVNPPTEDLPIQITLT